LCGQERSKSQKNGEITVWEKVSLFYTPSNRMITAQYQGMTATLVLTPEAEKLVPPELLDRLKGKKKEATASITVTPAGGKQFSITGIKQP